MPFHRLGFLEIQKKIIYQIMRVSRKNRERQEHEKYFAVEDCSIFKFLYFYVDLHFIFSSGCYFYFGEGLEDECENKEAAANVVRCRFSKKKNRTVERRKEGNKRFDCLLNVVWFFINFAVAFHPLFDVWMESKRRRETKSRRHRETLASCNRKYLLFVIFVFIWLSLLA